jgi:hypothetical protein
VSQEIIVGGLLRFCHKLVEKTVLGAWCHRWPSG